MDNQHIEKQELEYDEHGKPLYYYASTIKGSEVLDLKDKPLSIQELYSEVIKKASLGDGGGVCRFHTKQKRDEWVAKKYVGTVDDLVADLSRQDTDWDSLSITYFRYPIEEYTNELRNALGLLEDGYGMWAKLPGGCEFCIGWNEKGDPIGDMYEPNRDY